MREGKKEDVVSEQQEKKEGEEGKRYGSFLIVSLM